MKINQFIPTHVYNPGIEEWDQVNSSEKDWIQDEYWMLWVADITMVIPAGTGPGDAVYMVTWKPEHLTEGEPEFTFYK